MIRNLHRWLKPGAGLMVSSGGVVDEEGTGFTDTMFGHEFYHDSLLPDKMVSDNASIDEFTHKVPELG